MESLIVLLIVVIIGIPGSIIYLLARVSSLAVELRELQAKVNNNLHANSLHINNHKAATPENLLSKVSTSATLQPGTQSAKAVALENGDHQTLIANELAADALLVSARKLTPQQEGQADPQPLKKPTSQDFAEGREVQANKSTFSLPNPTILDRGLAFVKRYFSEGNLIVRVGVLVLFVGVAFLLKYASDRSLLPIELRIVGVALTGIAVLVLGWRLRLKNTDYALVLQGAGIGILYLTAFACLKLFHLLPAGLIFILLIIMVVMSALLAVLQNSRALAILGVGGGFLAPILTSSGDGSHIQLFSYYALLNLGIFSIAWFKSWRSLNLVGFVFTFVIGSAWGIKSYQPEMFASAEFFLILFFLLYVAISLLFASRQAPELKGYVDGTLIFGLPIVAFSLQAALVNNYAFALAYSAFAIGFFYLSLAWIYQKGFGNYHADPKLRLLSESFLALGTVFTSLTIPFALDGEWIASAWALEGAAILWISIRQNRRLGAFFALALQVLGGLGFLSEAVGSEGKWPIINSLCLGATLVAVAGLFSSYYLRRHGGNLSLYLNKLSIPLLIWGLCWWLFNGLFEIGAYVPINYQPTSILLFCAFSSLLFLLLEHRLRWSELVFNGLVLEIAMLALLGLFMLEEAHPFAYGGWLGWASAFAALLAFLYYRDRTATWQPDTNYRWIDALHLIGLWLAAIILTLESIWVITHFFRLTDAWLALGSALPAVIIINGLMRYRRWPLSLHRPLYLGVGCVPPVIFSLLWLLFANIYSTGAALPLPYLPLINPLDIVQALVLITAYSWWVRFGNSAANARMAITNVQVLIALATLIFIALNGMLLRSLHHWIDIPYQFQAIKESTEAQASLSIFWTLIGLATMVISSRKNWRAAWIGAAALLGITVAKLLFIDLGDREALVTILSFIVVGILLLVIGYFSPIPPKRTANINHVSD